MSRKAFHNLLERYLKGTCTKEEQETVQRWYDLLDNDEHLDLGEVEFDELEIRLWDKINAKTLHNEGKKKDHFKKKGLNRLWYTIAAAAIVLLIVGTAWVNQRLALYPIDPEFIAKKVDAVSIFSNIHDEPLEVVLPDSSRVKLFKGARIKYATTFAQRDIVLSGNALFNVSADPNHPFRVFHEGMVTKVLGTCFMIKEGGTGNNEVIVYSGKVEVTRSDKRSSIVERIIEKPSAVNLGLNQRVILNEEDNTLHETLAEDPVPIETKRTLLNEVVFREINLLDLTKKLSDVYGIDIKVKPNAKKVTFTGDLSDMELFNQLSIICNVTETNYYIEGKSIIIQ